MKTSFEQCPSELGDGRRCTHNALSRHRCEYDEKPTCGALFFFGGRLGIARCVLLPGHPERNHAAAYAALRDGAIIPCAGKARDPLALECITRPDEPVVVCPGCKAVSCYRHTHAWWRGECPGGTFGGEGDSLFERLPATS